MKCFLFTVFIFQIISFAQQNQNLIEKARLFLYNNETHHKPIFIDSVSIEIENMPYEKAKTYYKFNGEIKTPLTNTKFFTFSINTINPTPSYIIASYKDSLVLIIEWGCRKRYGCEKILNFLNERLEEEENKLDGNQLVELAYALVKISFPTWGFYRIISGYDDVSWVGEKNKIMYLPDTLKEIIKPIKIKNENNIVELEYYLWDEVILQKITLSYKNNEVNIKTNLIWNSGRRLSIM